MRRSFTRADHSGLGRLISSTASARPAHNHRDNGRNRVSNLGNERATQIKGLDSTPDLPTKHFAAV